MSCIRSLLTTVLFESAARAEKRLAELSKEATAKAFLGEMKRFLPSKRVIQISQAHLSLHSGREQRLTQAGHTLSINGKPEPARSSNFATDVSGSGAQDKSAQSRKCFDSFRPCA